LGYFPNATIYAYDALGHMVTQDGATLVYNGDGVLVQAGTTFYTQDLVAPLSQVLSDGTDTYLYGHNRLASVDSTGTRTWELHDALGSVRHTLDDADVLQVVEDEQQRALAQRGEQALLQRQGCLMWKLQCAGKRRGDVLGSSDGRQRHPDHAARKGRMLRQVCRSLQSEAGLANTSRPRRRAAVPRPVAGAGARGRHGGCTPAAARGGLGRSRMG
jgi:hypothetical protein